LINEVRDERREWNRKEGREEIVDPGIADKRLMVVEPESGQIDAPHLKAALAVWEYCESSAAFIFGDLLGDPVADEIARALQHAGPVGMTRTHIRDLFGRHRSADRI